MSKLHKLKTIKSSILLCMITILLLTSLTGCAPNPKNFSTSKITITLDETFTKHTSNSYEIYASSDDVAFTATEETEQELQLAGYELITLADYADEILSLNGDEGIKLTQRDDYYYFITSETVKGAKYTYIHCMYEGHDSFWVCQFACKSKDYKRLKDDLFLWADSITIAK